MELLHYGKHTDRTCGMWYTKKVSIMVFYKIVNDLSYTDY